MKTLNEISGIVEKAITEIRKSKHITLDLISKTCLKYDVSETHIMRVAGWEDQIII